MENFANNSPKPVKNRPQIAARPQLPQEHPQRKSRAGTQPQISMADREAMPQPGPEKNCHEEEVPEAVSFTAQGPQEGIPDPQTQPQGQRNQKPAGRLHRGHHPRSPRIPRDCLGSS